MKNAIAGLFLIFASVSPALAQTAYPPVGTQKTAFFNGTQALTRIFPAVAGKSLYLTQLTVSGAAAGTLILTTGTGSNCATNSATLFSETTIAGVSVSDGDGAGVLAVIGPSLDLCITVTTQALIGWVSVAQF